MRNFYDIYKERWNSRARGIPFVFTCSEGLTQSIYPIDELNCYTEVLDDERFDGFCCLVRTSIDNRNPFAIGIVTDYFLCANGDDEMYDWCFNPFTNPAGDACSPTEHVEYNTDFDDRSVKVRVPNNVQSIPVNIYSEPECLCKSLLNGHHLGCFYYKE